MLKIDIPKIELYDSKKEEFINFDPITVTFEHSLVSMAKWESKWHKPFLSREKHTDAELRDYIRCMTLTQNVNQEIYNYLPPELVRQINEYIDDPMTATKFFEKSPTGQNKVITNEIIYYWMIALGIPFECQKWHLNRLLTLIRVCEAKNNPKKMSQKDIYAQNRSLNALRRKAMKSKG